MTTTSSHSVTKCTHSPVPHSSRLRHDVALLSGVHRFLLGCNTSLLLPSHTSFWDMTHHCCPYRAPPELTMCLVLGCHTSSLSPLHSTQTNDMYRMQAVDLVLERLDRESTALVRWCVWVQVVQSWIWVWVRMQVWVWAWM